MITAGIDLAASPQNTAYAALRWREGRARIENLVSNLADDQFRPMPAEVTKIGIDCPLGWPLAFREFLDRQAAGTLDRPLDRVRDREPLAYRVTDLEVARDYRPLRPLSVTADRIAHVAFRCAALLPKLDPTLDRSGHGRVVEVYPAGSLFVWGRGGTTVPYRGYKADSEAAREKRERIVEALDPVVQFGFHRVQCLVSDHLLDAVIAAVTARAAELGHATLPSGRHLETARIEGWIAMPTASPADIVEVGARVDP